MNERIKELTEQAGMIIGDASNFDMAKFMPKEVKFAELIVRECIQLNGKELSMAAHSRMLEIYTEHFGIEQ